MPYAAIMYRVKPGHEREIGDIFERFRRADSPILHDEAGRPSGLVRGHTSVPSIGNTHAVSGSRGCNSIGKPMSPTSRGMLSPMRTHCFSGRSMR